MDSPEDCTAVVRIMGDFKDYINTDIQKRRVETMVRRNKQAEVLAVKSNVSILQREMEELKTGFQIKQVEFDREVEQLKLERQRDNDRIQELQAKLGFLAKQESMAQKECEELRKRLEKDKVILNEQTQEIRQEKLRLEARLVESEASKAEATHLQMELMKKDSQIQQLRIELEQSNAKLQHSMRRAVEVSGLKGQIRNFQEQALEAEKHSRELEQQLAQREDNIFVANVMKDQIGKLKELEKENKRLQEENSRFRETYVNITMLQERCASSETKLQRAEQRYEEISHVQVEYEALQDQLKTWEMVDPTGASKPRSPHELIRQIANLQQQGALLLAEKGQAISRTHALEEAYRTTNEKLSQTSQQLFASQEKMKHHDDFVKRLQRKLLLVTKERDSLRNILTEYDSEVTTVGNAMEFKTRMEQTQEILQTANRHSDRLEQELRAAIEEGSAARTTARQHELTIEQLQLQLNVATAAAAAAAEPSTSSVNPKELQELKDVIKQLQEERDNLAERNETLEAIFEQRAIQGDFDPTKTKVLHFGMNPSMMARQKRAEEIDVLKRECEMLKTRIRELEEGGANVSGEKLSDKFTESSSKELDDLKKELKSSEMRYQRLKEVFQKKIQSFRDACYQLTGYKIDNPKDNNYLLTSMYAESSEDSLMFQSTDTGNFQLLETEFSSTLGDLVEQYLIRLDSIPAFLSSLTHELFSRQTMMVTT
ncbi:mitotic spindle assembly checkpoint protein MAD1-like [Glandiceps talaboti]